MPVTMCIVDMAISYIYSSYNPHCVIKQLHGYTVLNKEICGHVLMDINRCMIALVFSQHLWSVINESQYIESHSCNSVEQMKCAHTHGS